MSVDGKLGWVGRKRNLGAPSRQEKTHLGRGLTRIDKSSWRLYILACTGGRVQLTTGGEDWKSNLWRKEMTQPSARQRIRLFWGKEMTHPGVWQWITPRLCDIADILLYTYRELVGLQLIWVRNEQFDMVNALSSQFLGCALFSFLEDRHRKFFHVRVHRYGILSCVERCSPDF